VSAKKSEGHKSEGHKPENGKSDRDRPEINKRADQEPGSELEPGVEQQPWNQATLFAEKATTYWLLVGLVFAAAIFMRLAFLAADPPWDYTWSQDVFTDGARVVDGARNKILFGQWITDPRSPVILFYPISTLIAWVIFKIGGVGLAQANLTGVLPGLACLVVMFYMMRRLEYRLGGLVGLIALAFCGVHVIFSRIPLVESLLLLMLLGAFWLALGGGRRDLFLSGLLVGLASFMVKLHALHFAPVVLIFLLVGFERNRESSPRKSHLALSFVGGIGVALGLWLATIYIEHPAIVAKYFKSNILLSQSADYQNLTFIQMAERRLSGLMHVGAGRDGYFVKIPELAIMAYLGLIGLVSRFSFRRPAAARWEVLSGIWFVGLVVAMSVLGYRPLRYLVLFTPSLCLLATSFLLRLSRGEPWLASPRPHWFVYAFGVWLAWVVLHIQQDIVFQIMTGGKSIILGSLNEFQKSLYKYQFLILFQLLIFGGAGFVITFIYKDRIMSANTSIPWRIAKRLFLVGVFLVVGLNTAKFVEYAADRKYSIVDTARSMKRILSDNVFLVGDCANTIVLETEFKSLAAYGDLIRYNEKTEFEQYPITHFLLRFPSLYEYLSDAFPDFREGAMPVRLYGLCGREATLLRFEGWPGYSTAGYRPSEFEHANDLLNQGDPEGAIPIYEDFLEQNPSSYEALWGIAVSQLELNKDDEARAYIERGLELTKTDALSYEVYGDVLASLGQHGQALNYWGKAREFNPGSKRVARKLGLVETETHE
jgi:tetratricopeptide (TPR) repeat protein